MLALSAFAVLDAVPARAQTSVTLVANTGQADNAETSGLNIDIAAGFTTGGNAAGYTLTRVDIPFLRARPAQVAFSVSIRSSSAGAPGASLGTLTNTGTLTANSTNTFAASGGGIGLTANTTYFLVIDVTGSDSDTEVSYTSSVAEDSGAAAGWSIANVLRFRVFGSTGSWTTDSDDILRFSVRGYAKTAPPPPPPPPPPPVIESPEGVSHSGNASDGFSLTPLGEGGSIVYRKRTIDIPVTRDECTSPGNPALIISRSTLDRVREITFELSEVSPQDPPPGFRMEGCVAEIDPGITLGQRETVAVCLPSAEVNGKSYVHRYDGEWEILPSRSETVNGEELVCGDTDSFSMFGVFLPVIESAEGVTHSEDKEHGFSLTPLGEGGSIVYGQKTIDLSVTGDVGSSGDPAVIVSRDVLDRVEEITFELSEVPPHDPPPGFYLEGFSAEVDMGVTLEQGETVSVCLPSSGGDIYRYSEELGEWEVLESRLEMVNGEEVVCGDVGAVSLTGVFVEDTGGCVIASASGERVLWRGAVFNLLLIMSVLLLVPWKRRPGVHGRKPLI